MLTLAADVLLQKKKRIPEPVPKRNGFVFLGLQLILPPCLLEMHSMGFV